jgi:hypothetical protein
MTITYHLLVSSPETGAEDFGTFDSVEAAEAAGDALMGEAIGEDIWQDNRRVGFRQIGIINRVWVEACDAA